jgi:hypothetical protein
MRIDNSFLFSPKAGEVQSNQETGATGQAGDLKGSQPVDLHIPSPELAGLRQLLQQVPDTRPDVLARVAQLVASNYYTTPEAALRTADSMVKAID